jgi:hypothetical protein
MRARATKNTKRMGGLLVTFAALLLGVAALLSAPAGAQTTGQTSGGATALNGSTGSGDGTANNNSTSSGNATADNGSTASGCSTALNNSTASGGLCLTAPTVAPTTTVTTAPPTTNTTMGGTTTTTGGTSPTTAPRLALTGSHTNRLVEVALGALFLGLLLVALGLEAPTRDPQA